MMAKKTRRSAENLEVIGCIFIGIAFNVSGRAESNSGRISCKYYGVLVGNHLLWGLIARVDIL